jgi:hypothetical protein
MADNQIWERLPSDTDKSFEAFCIYRDMGTTRSLEKAWRKYKEGAETVPGYFKDWSREHNWVERVNAYDDYLRDLHRKRLESAKLKVADNVLNDYERFRSAIDKRLKIMEDTDFVASEDALHSLLNLMHKLDDYARRAVGLPSEIKESKTTNNTSVSGTLNVTNRQLPPLPDSKQR